MSLKKIYSSLNSIKLSVYQDKIIQLIVGEFPTNEEIFPKWLKNNSGKIKWFKTEGYKRKKPITIDKKINFRFEKQYLLKEKDYFFGQIKNARVISNSANIITDDNIQIDKEIASQGAGFSNIKNYLILPRIKEINSRVFTVSNSDNYFHWMFEVLPRFKIIKRYFKNNDLLLISDNKKFKNDSIKQLGIKQKQILGLDKNTHIKARELAFVSMPIHSGNPSKETCDYVRKLFLKKN